jgi:hypothetical protein
MGSFREMTNRWAAAHKIGVEYHHYVTRLMSNKRQDRGERERLARRYLDAFLDLEKYLSTLDATADVIALRKSANTHIEFVRNDLNLLRNRAQGEADRSFRHEKTPVRSRTLRDLSES